jgi:hypothetical protein
MNNESRHVSKRMAEVWEWKETIARKVAHLPIDEALTEIMKNAAEASKATPLPRFDPRISSKLGALGKVS